MWSCSPQKAKYFWPGWHRKDPPARFDWLKGSPLLKSCFRQWRMIGRWREISLLMISDDNPSLLITTLCRRNLSSIFAMYQSPDLPLSHLGEILDGQMSTRLWSMIMEFRESAIELLWYSRSHYSWAPTVQFRSPAKMRDGRFRRPYSTNLSQKSSLSRKGA